jgi:hypothetical protein
MTTARGGDNLRRVRKGDLILVERVDRDYYLDGRGVVERTSYTFGVVASASRDGTAKAFHRVGYGDELVSSGHVEPVNSRLVSRYWVMSTRDIDVTEVLRAAKAHHWPGHPGQPRAFETLDDAKAVARPHLTQPHGGRRVTVRDPHGNHGGSQ